MIRWRRRQLWCYYWATWCSQSNRWQFRWRKQQRSFSTVWKSTENCRNASDF